MKLIPYSNYATGPKKISSSNGRYTKKESFIERVSKNPVTALHEAFKLNIDELLWHLLPNWLRTTLMNNECQYSNGGNDQVVLCEFYDQLAVLIQALFIITKNRQSVKNGPINSIEWKEKCKRCDVPFLSDGEITDPRKIIKSFYEQFSIEYVRRELRDFLDAAIGYDGTYPKDFSPWLALMTYEHTVCLVEAAWIIYTSDSIKV